MEDRGKIKTSSAVGYFAILEDGQGFENNNLHWVLGG